MNKAELREARFRAADRVGGTWKMFWVILGMTGIWGFAFLFTLTTCMDLTDPVQRLIVIATLFMTGLICGTIAMAVIALAGYTRWSSAGILQAVKTGPDKTI